jgi:hypothetical protein
MERTVNRRTQIEAPKNLVELNSHLMEIYADVSNDRAMVAQADTAANVAGKIHNLTRLQMEALKMTGGKMNKTQREWILGADATTGEKA